MNASHEKGNWEEQKSRLKEKFAAITDNDFLFVKDKREEMIAKLQTKLGKTEEEIHNILRSL